MNYRIGDTIEVRVNKLVKIEEGFITERIEYLYITLTPELVSIYGHPHTTL